MTAIANPRSIVGISRRGKMRDVEPSNKLNAFVKEINSRPDAVPDALVAMYKEAVRRHGR